MELVGRVLWWSEKDENGIICCPFGNEFYFDRSVLQLKTNQKIARNSFVIFNINQSIKDCLCACNVQVPQANKKKTFENKFLKEASSYQLGGTL